MSSKKLALTFGVLCVLATGLTQHDAIAFENSKTITYPYYAFEENPETPWESVWDALDATGTIRYSDEFFDGASPGVHPALRVASYALSLAGFENEADGYPAVSVNHKLYTMLSEMGFAEPQSWDTISEPNGHSMGVTVAYKTLKNGQNLVVVVPRSYNYMTEWLSNFNVGLTGDHAGFSEASGLVTERLEQYIADHNLTDNKIWIVGYSRGGAVVDLAAKAINQNLAAYNVSADNLYAYTFGAPRASLAETKYSNIHDVKDGNDLILGYLFPGQWGFYNTGTHEGIHDADLEIATYAVNIEDLADSSKLLNLISGDSNLTLDTETRNAKEFMDEWLEFIISHGMTREYFNESIRPPVSAIMQLLQLRTIDKQSEVSGFITDTERGMPMMILQNLFVDLMTSDEDAQSLEEKLENFAPYKNLVKVLKGTATSEEINSLADALGGYIGEYDDYEEKLYQAPSVTREEFAVIKENMPKLIKAIGPLLVEDAKHTQTAYGENASLYYGYTLVSNFYTLVYAHIPESIMPLLENTVTPEEKDILSISGIEEQSVLVTGEPVVLTGTLVVEDNDDGVTADDLTTTYYRSDGSTEIARPSEAGFYVVKYSFESKHYVGSLMVPFQIRERAINTVYTHVEGGGHIVAPSSVLEGDNLHVEFVPDEGYELRYASVDGHYLEEEDGYTYDMIAGGDGYYNIHAGFWPVYEVIDGDGSKFTLGSRENLSFKINTNLEAFYGSGLVSVNGQFLGVDSEWTVDPDTQTITLKGDFMASLGLGEYKLEAIDCSGEMWVARAKFVVVNSEAEGEDDAESGVPVPNTGIFTGGNGSTEVIILAVVFVTLVIASGVFARRLIKSRH